MQDYLIELGQHKAARKIAQTIGVPVPQKLLRSKSPWQKESLKEKALVIGGPGVLHGLFGRIFTEAGAGLTVISDRETTSKAYDGLKKVSIVSKTSESPKCHALIYDATGIEKPEDLKDLYNFYHQRIKSLSPNGRIVVVGRPHQSQTTLKAAAAYRALEGFTRSLAKEVGRKGATAQLVTVEENPLAQSRLDSVLLFLLSPKSAFISGQVLAISSEVVGKALQSMSQSLKDKVALVTGAARGIGAATAQALAIEGAKVVCLDRPEDEKPLADVALDIGGKLLLQDISKPDAAHNIQSFLKENFGGVDIVVHNAGVTRDKTIANMDEGRWDSTIGINLAAVIDISEKLLEDGLRDGGRLICLSSIAGIAGNFGQTNYAASKAGVIGFVDFLSKKLNSRGITVNAVAPGFIETRLTAAIPFVTREAARRLSNVSQGGLPEDIANAITFLSTPAAQGVNGQVIRVCGGSLIGA